MENRKIGNFLSMLNIQVKYRVIDRFTKEIIYDSQVCKEFTREEKNDFFERTIYMIFSDKEDNSILNIYVF